MQIAHNIREIIIEHLGSNNNSKIAKFDAGYRPLRRAVAFPNASLHLPERKYSFRMLHTQERYVVLSITSKSHISPTLIIGGFHTNFHIYLDLSNLRPGPAPHPHLPPLIIMADRLKYAQTQIVQLDPPLQLH